MVRINLLPPEIIERRKYERFYPYVFIAGGLLLAMVVASWGATQWVVGGRATVLQQTRENTQGLNEQAAALAVFELRESEFDARQQAATQALEGRVDMGSLAEEISMVLPEEVWVERLFINEETGVTLNADTPNSDDRTMAEGYKSVAATLVRLSTLDDLHDVWLTGARSQIYTFMGSTSATTPVVAFESTARLRANEPSADSASNDPASAQ